MVERDDENAEALRLDANAVAGDLEAWFGVDVTDQDGQCGHCGNVAPMGTLLAYTHGPGTVLRCSQCLGVVLRVVTTPVGMYLDAQGAAWMSRPAAVR